MTGFKHPNKNQWKEGVECMFKVANTPLDNSKNKQYKKLIHQAQYNVGKACFQGFGIKQSDKETERYWLLASDNGSSHGCISAMTALAFFYSRKSDGEFFDLKKAFYWHNEACGLGSVESQGVLGAMYYFGLGTRQDMQAAHECLSNSSERGNVYSMGLLCDYYYNSKFYVKAFELAKK
jgi:TPR repeat protein